MEKLEQSLDGLQIKPEEASLLAEHNDSSNDAESNNQRPAKIHEVNMDYVTSFCFVLLMIASWNTVKLSALLSTLNISSCISVNALNSDHIKNYFLLLRFFYQTQGAFFALLIFKCLPPFSDRMLCVDFLRPCVLIEKYSPTQKKDFSNSREP